MRYPLDTSVACHFGLNAVCVWAWQAELPAVALLCWVPMAHLGHSVLLAFHEAVHFNLAPNRLLNEVRGLILGTLALVPLSVYRHAHRSHHARLSSANDAELWPYNQTSAPRWARVLAAAVELTCGLLFTPLLFLRGVLVDPPKSNRARLRIAAEYLLLAVFWGAVLGVIHAYGWWTYFCVGYLIPAVLSGNLQSWRKFIEHMGLYGDSPTTLSRTVIHQSKPGRVLAYSMLNVSYHGTHHRFGGVAFENLPETTRSRLKEEEQLIFPSYWRALLAMLPSLANPRVGKQWIAVAQDAPQNAPLKIPA